MSETLSLQQSTSPEDIQYAEEICPSIIEWAAERYQKSKRLDFKLSECNDQFKTVTEVYLVLACELLQLRKQLNIDNTSRITRYSYCPAETLPVLIENMKLPDAGEHDINESGIDNGNFMLPLTYKRKTELFATILRQDKPSTEKDVEMIVKKHSLSSQERSFCMKYSNPEDKRLLEEFMMDVPYHRNMNTLKERLVGMNRTNLIERIFKAGHYGADIDDATLDYICKHVYKKRESHLFEKKSVSSVAENCLDISKFSISQLPEDTDYSLQNFEFNMTVLQSFITSKLLL
jgi:hypothetical protein